MVLPGKSHGRNRFGLTAPGKCPSRRRGRHRSGPPSRSALRGYRSRLRAGLRTRSSRRSGPRALSFRTTPPRTNLLRYSPRIGTILGLESRIGMDRTQSSAYHSTSWKHFLFRRTVPNPTCRLLRQSTEKPLWQLQEMY